tara:strand:+ start:27 stop:1130 length:1104 start_codon:yes stop_codon:yes gene_type:complete
VKYPIVKPFLPSIDAYKAQIDGIFERCWLTNNGQCLQEFERQLADYLGVNNLLLVANGTLALQIAFAALNIKGKALTTPFTFAATASALKFACIEPEFIDIDPDTYNIDIEQATSKQLSEASALVGVHVFGNPCEVEAIDRKAKEYDLKVIYDAAHAFASDINGKTVLEHGDVATLSLHATKLFHSVEGGAIIFKHKADYLKAKQLINFGFNSDFYPELVGINAKMSEMHAAMGLCLLEHLPYITQKRRTLVAHYQECLSLPFEQGLLSFQKWHAEGNNNGAYMPVVLKNEQQLLQVQAKLLEQGIQTRRYFYPSLSTVPAYGMQGSTPHGNELSLRILCLPMFTDLTLDGVEQICSSLISAIQTSC